MDSLKVRLDGKPAASSVISRRRKILNAAAEYAVELKLLDSDPVPALKWKAPKPVQVVDPRCVPNPVQARTLLAGCEIKVGSGGGWWPSTAACTTPRCAPRRPRT
jgi:hypothetical protein